jgi:periplasmic protein TonB
MAPSIHIEEVRKHQQPEHDVGKEIELQLVNVEPVAPKQDQPNMVRPAQPAKPAFHSPLMENNRMKSGSRFLDALISLTVNLCILVVPTFAGLYFTDSLDLKQFANTFLVAPPPPPPPPPAAGPLLKAAPVHRVFENSGRLVAPTVVPKQVAMLKEEAIPDVGGGDGVPGGVPGGVAGGSLGGVIGGVIGGTGVAPAPIAPKEKGPRAPVRVGGRVKEPRLITRIDPKYPELARMTHLQGEVVIDAIIDEHGDVQEAQVISGPALLLQSALEAVRHWKYEPTYLNDQAIPVQLKVTVSFRLSQ